MAGLRVLAALALALGAACGGPADKGQLARSDSALAPGAAGAWIVSPAGVGPVQVGWPLAQVQLALGDSLRPGTPPDSCGYLVPRSFPSGLLLMIEDDTLVRIDVESPGIKTAEGAQVGDTEAALLALYASRAEVQPHKYTGPQGHYVVVRVPGDSLSLLIFETDGHKVERFRAGRRPAVEYVEGCA